MTALFVPSAFKEFRFFQDGEPITLSIYWDRQPTQIESTLLELPVWTPLLAWLWQAQVWYWQAQNTFVATAKLDLVYHSVTAPSVEELVLSARQRFGDE